LLHVLLHRDYFSLNFIENCYFLVADKYFSIYDYPIKKSTDDTNFFIINRNILLNYAVYNPDMGYTQGMSDLVAPVLATLHDEVDCFWCFVGLMESSMFATTPRDDSMDKSLVYVYCFQIYMILTKICFRCSFIL